VKTVLRAAVALNVVLLFWSGLHRNPTGSALAAMSITSCSVGLLVMRIREDRGV
jgi:hypothetical protein